MGIRFGREICGELGVAQQREWLITNGIGGYASGTVAGVLTRGYHGLLVAALNPPLGRTLLVSNLEETAEYDDRPYPLATDRWADGSVNPQGYRHIESFYLEGTLPTWHFALGDALLEKQLWMQRGANTTYVRYSLRRGSRPLTLSLKALVNYRDYHSRTRGRGWQMQVSEVDRGIGVTAFNGAVPVYLLADRGNWTISHTWYMGLELAAERDRGLYDLDDVLHTGTLEVTLQPGECLTVIASTDRTPDLDAVAVLNQVHHYERNLLETWKNAHPPLAERTPDWINQLVLAADQFVVDRPLPDSTLGKTLIAGYHWFADWGRDTMISLPGLTLTTGRPEIARAILSTFAQSISRGMLPNRFPDGGNPLGEGDYNTVDATLWYFEAVRQYFALTGDRDLLDQLFPVLEGIVDWHIRGTRFNIYLDRMDGLIYAGEPGVQLTWMDAKIGDRVITPRIGKPIEINALWYCALRTMAHLAESLGKSGDFYRSQAEVTQKGCDRFWNEAKGYCFDVIDGPDGEDDSLRPNQVFAISLPAGAGVPPLLSQERQRQVVEVCGRSLLTSYGMRSLAPDHPQYRGQYAGDSTYRDSVYHQGTAWGWLLGPFALAHAAAFGDRPQAAQLLEPIARHLDTAGLGTISEIFDGDAPMRPQGCIAQAWSVAEVLRAWYELTDAGR